MKTRTAIIVNRFVILTSRSSLLGKHLNRCIWDIQPSSSSTHWKAIECSLQLISTSLYLAHVPSMREEKRREEKRRDEKRKRERERERRQFREEKREDNLLVLVEREREREKERQFKRENTERRVCIPGSCPISESVSGN